jgi:Transglutaminase-like superfamily/Domain of Unknown Function with PDB structure (DUF3857)
MKTIFSFLFMTTFFFTSFAQKKVDPDEKDLQIARSLKEKFPDDNVALELSKDHVSFGISRKNNKVTVRHQLREVLINLNTRADIHKYCFYDGETKISEFNIQYKNKKTALFYIKDEAYTSNDLFHNDTRVKYVSLDFPLRGYRYLSTITKEYKDVKYFTKLYFNDEYPIAKKVITIEIPDWLELELKEINFDGFDIKKEVTNNKSKIYTYTMENVTARHKEGNAPGPTYIYPHILILPKSFTQNNSKTVIFNSTQDLYNWYKSLVNSLENDEKPFKDKVDELTQDAVTDDEKIKNIYYWVQDNIRYIAFEDGIAGFKPDEAANVYNKKYGDCKGMANLCKQMLIEAGFDARLTWIGTKRIAYDYSTPNLSVDNHMICTIIKDGKMIFLDGTEKFSAFGEYANRIQGKQVLIEDGDDFILKKVPISDEEFNKEKIIYSLTLEGENIVGEVNKNYNGESRAGLLGYFSTLKNDKKDEFLERYLNKGSSNIKVSNIQTTDLLDRELSLDITYNISIKNAVSAFDDDIYIDIDFDKELSNLNLEKRKTNYLFRYKKDVESITTLQIPVGYKATHLPENLAVSSENYDLKVTFSQQENTITYEKHFAFKNAKIETSDFDEWNKFIKSLNNIYNQQIILTKQ